MTAALPTPSPRYLPAGFAHRRTIEGENVGAFSTAAPQRADFYTLGWERDDFLYPLVICVASDATAALVGTEGHPGRGVRLDDGTVATYHNGAWATGPGPLERRSGPVVIHWEAAHAHSIVFQHGDVAVGIRGAKSRGVPFDVLARVGASFAY